MENVKNIGKIDIHAHAIAFKEYYPPYTPNDKNTVFADDKEVLEFYDEIGIEKGCEEFHIFGATGGRIAHTLGNLQILKHLADKGLVGYIFDRDTVITVISKKTHTFCNTSGYISLVPFGCDKATVTLSGFKYELTHGDLPSDRPLGISNEFCGDKSSIAVHSGTVIAVWESAQTLPEKYF